MITTRFSLACLLALLLSTGAIAQQQSIRSFMFGHSLMDHRPPLNPTPSDETTIAHWIYLLSQAAGHTYEATGRFGPLELQASNLPPSSDWGYDIVPRAWDNETQPSFAAADFNNAIFTELNYVQWQAPTDPYWNGNGTSPVTAAANLTTWLKNQEPNIAVYLYENWPDMAPFIAGEGFPASTTEFANYCANTQGEWHDWWIDYHDALTSALAGQEVLLIPVGPIMAELQSSWPLNQIAFEDWYEDNAPHGRPNLYFLAGLITYSAIFQEQAPSNFTPPTLLHSTLQEEYASVKALVWNALQTYTFPNGDSRVFSNFVVPVTWVSFTAKDLANERILLEWETSSESNNAGFEVEYSLNGKDFVPIGFVDAQAGNQGANYSFIHTTQEGGELSYRLRQTDWDGSFSYSTLQTIKRTHTTAVQVFPNPTAGRIQITIPSDWTDVTTTITVRDLFSRSVTQREVTGQSIVPLDLGHLPAGRYQLGLRTSNQQINHTLLVQ